MGSFKVVKYEIGNLMGTTWVPLRSFDTTCQGCITFMNNTNKTMRKVEFDAFLGDRLGDEVNDSWNIHKLTEFRGPLEPGEIGKAYTRSLMGVNHLVADVGISYADIVYMDGTTEHMG